MCKGANKSRTVGDVQTSQVKRSGAEKEPITRTIMGVKTWGCGHRWELRGKINKRRIGRANTTGGLRGSPSDPVARGGPSKKKKANSMQGPRGWVSLMNAEGV